MALTSALQDDFGGGMYRGRRAPANSVYDAVNALVNDEGQLFRRGGSAYYSNANAGTTLYQVYDAFLQPGQRTVALSAAHLYALNGTTPVDVFSSVTNVPTTGRAVGIAGMLAIPTAAVVAFYGGSLKTAAYATGTVTVTNASRTVTGVGTLWSANVDVGMIISSGLGFGLVASVDSNTQITLRDTWTAVTAAGAAYSLDTMAIPEITAPSTFVDAVNPHLAAVGSTPRLVVTTANRAYYSPRGQPFTIATTDYIELPASALITGAQGLGGACLLFSTDGVWLVENMDLAPVDDFGNIQWAQSQVNRDIALWGEPGIAAFGGQTIVPAVDDVYIFSLGAAPQPITGGRGGNQYDGGIRSLYRSYVKAGYQPGNAVVHRGHYFLPIINGTTLVDVLVCGLDRGAAWTRWNGHAAGFSYAARVGSSTRAPKLLSVAGQRITDLTDTFDSTTTNASEADATVPDCTITTRDYPTGGNQHGLVHRLRLRYELTDDGSGATAAPTVALAYSSDQDAGAFTTLTDKGLQGGGTGGAVSAGDKYNFWLVGKRRERIRFRITQSGAAASFILRSLEMLSRATGKQ